MPIISDPGKVSHKGNTVRYEDKKISKWWGKTLYYLDPKTNNLHYRNFSVLGRILQCFGYKSKYNPDDLNNWKPKSIKLISSVPSKNDAKIEASDSTSIDDALEAKKLQFENLCSDNESNNDEIIGLIKSGLDVNTVLSSGNTLLHVACQKGRESLVDYLLDNGANNIPNADGDYPLHLAVENYSKNPSKKKDSGEFDDSPNILTHLLSSTNANLSGKNGETPLYRACVNGDYNTVEYLLTNLFGRPDVNFLGENGVPPLNAAVLSGDIKLVKLLVEKGVDKDLKDKGGQVAQVVAFKNGFIDIFNYFQLQYFIDTKKKDE